MGLDTSYDNISEVLSVITCQNKFWWNLKRNRKSKDFSRNSNDELNRYSLYFYLNTFYLTELFLAFTTAAQIITF
jgi:hypothetical protein